MPHTVVVVKSLCDTNNNLLEDIHFHLTTNNTLTLIIYPYSGEGDLAKGFGVPPGEFHTIDHSIMLIQRRVQSHWSESQR